MAGLFGDVRGDGSIGLFGRQRRITDEEQRRLAELASLAGELGASPQSQSLPAGAFPEPSGQSLAPTAQLHSLPRDAFPGTVRAPFEPRNNDLPFPMGAAGNPQMPGPQGGAGGSLQPLAIGGLRAEAEGYADQIAQRGTREWGSAVRDFVIKGPADPGNLAVRPNEASPSGGFGSAAEEEGLGFDSAAMQSAEFGQADAEAGSPRPAALWREGKGSPKQFMHPAAFQGGAGGRALNRATRSHTAPRGTSTPDEPWIVQNGRYVPNPNWRNPAPNLEYYAAFGPPLAGLAAAAASPSIYGLSRADLIRYGPTDIPNAIAKGPGVPGRTKAPALKGGGKDMPLHYHIHRYNWNKPWKWFKYTATVKGKPPP